MPKEENQSKQPLSAQRKVWTVPTVQVVSTEDSAHQKNPGATEHLELHGNYLLSYGPNS